MMWAVLALAILTTVLTSGDASGLPTFTGRNGPIVFDRSFNDKPGTLWIVSAHHGDASHLAGSSRLNLGAAQVSPNGKKVVAMGARQGDSNNHIWVIDVGSGKAKKVTGSHSTQAYPQWSPNGRWIAYERYPKATRPRVILKAMHPDGSAKHVISKAKEGLQIGSWAPDSRRIVFTRYISHGSDQWSELEIARLGGGHTRTVIQPTADNLRGPQWSPTSNRIVYEDLPTNWRGSRLISVRPDGSHQRVLARGPGAHTTNMAPSWSPDGRKIGYLRCSPWPGTGILVCKLFAMRANGSAKRKVAPADVEDFAWSPSGRKLVYSHTKAPESIYSQWRLWVTRSNGSKRLKITHRVDHRRQSDTAPSWGVVRELGAPRSKTMKAGSDGAPEPK